MARSAALLSGFVLLAVSLREGVGLFDAAYRDQYSHDPLGGWVLATRGLGLVVALVVLLVDVPGHERRRGAHPSAPGAADDPEAWWRRSSRICGVLFLLMGLARLGWTVGDDDRGWARATTCARWSTVRCSARSTWPRPPSSPPSDRCSCCFVLGVLALPGRREVRGALLVFAALQLYLTVRMVVWLTVTDFFNRSFETPGGVLSSARRPTPWRP